MGLKLTLKSSMLLISGLFITLYAPCVKAENTKTNINITQEVRYQIDQASEVYIVWGINNWSMAEPNLRPEGTSIKDGLLYTRMTQTEKGFSTVFKVPQGTVIDYVFWITKAGHVETDCWDTNTKGQKDYHTYAMTNGTALIEADNTLLKPKEAINVLNSSGYILGFAGLMFCGGLLYRRKKNSKLFSPPSTIYTILGTCLALFLMLLPARATVMGMGWELYSLKPGSIPGMIFSGYYDFIFILIIACIFLPIAYYTRNKPRASKIVGGTFGLVSILTLISSILNIKVVEIIGKPFNYQWLYYSDFLGSSDSKTAIAANVSSNLITQIIYSCMALGLFSFVFATLFQHLSSLKYKRVLKFAVLPVLLCCYLISAHTYKSKRSWDYAKMANPIAAFIESINPLGSAPSLFTMDIEDGLSEFSSPTKKTSVSQLTFDNSKIKNVILFVMESTPAEYLQPYNSKFSVTPVLDKYSSNAIVFNNIYAHAPATNKSMVCMLNSMYPWLSFNSITQEHPDVKTASLPSELSKKGYRTAFFNAGDNRFQGAENFLKHRNFSSISDYRSLKCEKGFKVDDPTWKNLDGANDECLVSSFTSWLGADTAKPFFSMFWTYQTHYPYFIEGQEKDYGVENKDLNKYLNAVHHSDMVLGQLISELESRNLAQSTLIVVVGDHGEAFGRHEQTTHASKIYEENLHIPMILINPAINKQSNNNLGGLVDLAPTILNVLGYSQPASWQGQSVFSSTPKQREYFFAPWSNYLFGYREGDFKYIYDATNDRAEVYDLKNDPEESINLANKFPEKTEKSLQYMGGWVQYQEKYTSDLFSKK